MSARGMLLAAAATALLWAGETMADDFRPVRFGAKAGLNTSTRFGDLAEMEWVNGIAGGISIRFHLGRGPWFGADLLYSRKGSAWAFPDAASELRLTYLELPLLAGYPLGISPRVYVEPHLGLAPAYKTDEELTINASTFSSHYFRDWDLGAILGLGVRYESGGIAFTLESRYTVGLRDIDDPDESEFRGTDRNRSISILVGVLF